MSRRWQRFLLLGAAAWLLFLVATFPAAHAYRLLQEHLPGVVLSGIEGTLWSGSADLLQAHGVRLENLEWEMRLWPLLLGRLDVALQVREKELQLKGHLGRTIGGALYLEQLQGRIPISRIQELTPYRVPELGGVLRFENLEISLADGLLRRLSGEVQWSGARLTLGSPLELGGFVLQLQSDSGQTTGTLRDNGGPLQAEGVLKLTPEGEYSFNGVFTPKDSSSELAGRMRMLGSPNAAGGYPFEYSGRVPLARILDAGSSGKKPATD